MNLRYKGNRPRVIAPVRGREIHVEPGEVFEVGEALGASLLEQARLFEPADPPAAPAVDLVKTSTRTTKRGHKS